MDSQEKKPAGKKRAKKIAYYALLGFFCLVFICSAIYVGTYFLRSAEVKSEYKELQDVHDSFTRPYVPLPGDPDYVPLEPTLPTEPADPNNPITNPNNPTAPTTPNVQAILPELQLAYSQNKDLVGWIQVPGTKVNYPVVQPSIANLGPYRKHNNECYFYNEWALPDYYLKHTFYGECSEWGAIYVQEGCNVFTPSDNITIYGHHMMDGSMFSGLDGYKKQSFWETHQFIYFDTLYERHVYQVIAAFKTSGNYGEGFAYHTYDDMNEEQFNRFISTVMSLAYYDTGLTAQYGDRLITLSTCEYTQDNGRHVVIAKRVA